MKESVLNYHPLNVRVIYGSNLWYVSSFYCMETRPRAEFNTLKIWLKYCCFCKEDAGNVTACNTMNWELLAVSGIFFRIFCLLLQKYITQRSWLDEKLHLGKKSSTVFEDNLQLFQSMRVLCNICYCVAYIYRLGLVTVYILSIASYMWCLAAITL